MHYWYREYQNASACTRITRWWWRWQWLCVSAALPPTSEICESFSLFFCAGSLSVSARSRVGTKPGRPVQQLSRYNWDCSYSLTVVFLGAGVAHRQLDGKVIGASAASDVATWINSVLLFRTTLWEVFSSRWTDLLSSSVSDSCVCEVTCEWLLPSTTFSDSHCLSWEPSRAKIKSKHSRSVCCDPTMPWRQRSPGPEVVFNEEHMRSRTGRAAGQLETSPAILTCSSCCLLLIQSVSKQFKTQQNAGQTDVGQGLCV